jgi:hypothetical protein
MHIERSALSTNGSECGETASAISATIILGLVTVVAYARWKIVPIATRQHANSAD